MTIPVQSRAPGPASLRTYAILIGVMVAAKLVIMVSVDHFPIASQELAFAWPTLAGIALVGLGGLYLAPRAGFPDFWDPSVTWHNRFLWPAVTGFICGAVAVLDDLANPLDIHTGFPVSIPFYIYGALFLEIMLRLFGLTLLTWVFLRLRLGAASFWIACVFVSLYEPWPRMMAELSAASPIAGPGIVVSWAFTPLFLANLLTGVLYRRGGFLAAFGFRLAHYAVWHIGYGSLRPTWWSLFG